MVRCYTPLAADHPAPSADCLGTLRSLEEADHGTKDNGLAP